MMWRGLVTGLLAIAVLLVSLSAADATSIGVNFRRESNGATLMDAGDIAGVIPQANWNNAPADNVGTEAGIVGPTAGVVVDDLGAPTGMTMTFNAPGTWSAGTTGSGGAADKKMMTGYLDMTGDGQGQTITVELADIPYAMYDVYIYHSSAGGPNRSMLATVNDGLTSATYYTRNLSPADRFDGFTLDQHLSLANSNASEIGGNYLHFRALEGSGLTITTMGIGAADGGHPGGGNTRRGPIQGIQVVLIPEPATLSLFGLGGLAALLRRRKRR